MSRKKNLNRDKAIGQRLKTIRVSKNLTISDISSMINSSGGYISEVENGKKSLSQHSILQYTRIFNVNIHWLLTGKGEKFTNKDDKESSMNKEDFPDFSNKKLPFGQKLKEIRKSKGLTLKELGNATNVSSGFLSEVETGKKKPGSDVLISLMKFLGISLDELVEQEHAVQNEKKSSEIVQPTLPPLKDWGKKVPLKEIQKPSKICTECTFGVYADDYPDLKICPVCSGKMIDHCPKCGWYVTFPFQNYCTRCEDIVRLRKVLADPPK